MENTREDIYTRITNQIIEAMEAGAKSLRMPWHITDAPCFQPINVATRRSYRGVNVLSLWAIADKRQYPTGNWATYQQWAKLGGKIKKGEKAALVVLWKLDDREQAEEQDAADKKRRFLARGYSVFNLAQVEGYEIPETPKLSDEERVSKAEHFFRAVGVGVNHGGNEPYYDIEQDLVWMPDFANFRTAFAYYSILAHETTHWTGAKCRLDRELGNRYGSDAYAMEELIAELGSAFVCSHLNLSTEPRPEHASYIESWLRVLKQDKRAIFTAAAKAQQATDWMLSQLVNARARVAA